MFNILSVLHSLETWNASLPTMERQLQMHLDAEKNILGEDLPTANQMPLCERRLEDNGGSGYQFHSDIIAWWQARVYKGHREKQFCLEQEPA